MQVYPKSYCIQHKTKRYSFHLCRLMFIFSNADGTTAAGRFLYSNLCIELFRQRQAYSESCYISRKTKAAGLPPYRLMFIFSQRRRHDCRMAFSLLESVHRIISPVQTIPTLQTYPESCYIHEKQSGTVFTHTACCLFFPNADSTAATGRFLYPNLCIESLRQCGHMRNNSHHAIMTGKLLQQLYRILQRHFI